MVTAKISAREIFFVFTVLLNGSYGLILPHTLLKATGVDGMICFIIASLIAVLVVLIIDDIAMTNRNCNLIELVSLFFGTVVGKIVGGVFCIFFTFQAAFCIRLFVEMIFVEMLPNTPRVIILAMAMIVLGILVCHGLEDIGRFTLICAPIVMISISFLVLANIGSMRLERVLPLYFMETSVWQEGVLQSLGVYLFLLHALMLYPQIQQAKNMRKTLLYATLFGGGLVFIKLMAIIAIFGIEGGSRLVWSSIELSRMIHLGSFLERVEVIFIVIWLSVIFLNGSILIYTGALAWKQLLGGKSSKRSSVMVSVLVFLLALFIEDFMQLMVVQHLYYQYGIYSMLGMLLLVWVAAKRYRRKEAAHSEKG